jgi:hypothetical protein
LDDEARDWVNAPNLRVALDRPTGQTDDSFGQGTKEDTEVPAVVDGSIPNNKSDLTRFYVADERIGDDQFLYLAWERVQEPTGTTNMDFEFNQSPVRAGNGVTPVRTAGDVLIKYDLAQGGTSPVLGYHVWVTSGDASAVCEASNSVPCWGKVQDLTGNFQGSINTVAVADPVATEAPRNLSVRTFGEAAVNLTDSGIVPPGTCTTFGSAYLKSRASDSFTAALKDFIAPIPVDISNCGTIVVDKVTDPSGDRQSFGFRLSGGPSALDESFSLTDAAAPFSRTNLPAGSGYSLAEAVPTGWDLTAAVCSDGSPVTDIAVSPDETVTCTFTNARRGTIVVEKQTDPDGASGSFLFTGDAAGTIGDGGRITVADLVPGTYTSTEVGPTAGFDLASVVCDDADSSGDVANRTATFRLGAGETVTCTFTNHRLGSIAVHKVDDRGNPLPGVTFTLFADRAPTGGARGAEDADAAGTCTTDAGGDCTFADVAPGQYWVVETEGLPGYALPADQHVVLAAGAAIGLTFVDPQEHVVIVLVCEQGTNTLAASAVTDGAKTAISLDGLGLTADQQSALCALGGARFEGKPHGKATVTVDVGSGAH